MNNSENTPPLSIDDQSNYLFSNYASDKEYKAMKEAKRKSKTKSNASKVPK